MIWSAVLLSVVAVDRAKFRTCEQGSFCRRYRTWVDLKAKDPVQWEVVSDLAEPTFDLKNVHEDAATLIGQINFYACGAIRIRVNEKNPLRPRYTIPVGDVIEDAPTISPKPTTTTDGISYQWQSVDKLTKFRLDVTSKPFRLEMYVNGVLSQTINGEGLFNFEIYRHRTRKDKIIDAANHPTVDENGLWEENFSSFTDKKPYGPAALGVDVVFNEAKNGVYGLPEHATNLKLKSYDEPYRLYNLDVFEYELDESAALYGAVPIIWAPGKESTTAFLWVNPSETFVKVRNREDQKESRTWWTSESGVMDMILFPGPTPHAVSTQFHAMTGQPQLPPQFALGMHQCRWNYKDERDVSDVDDKFEQYDIPYDVIWLDIEHTNGKRYFTWDSRHFPTPQEMRNKLALHQRQLVTIVDPHIKTDSDFFVYKSIQGQELFCKKRNWEMMDDPTDEKPADYPDLVDDPTAPVEEGQELPKIANPNPWKARQILKLDSPTSQYDGYCWPGTSSYPDFVDPKMRELWMTFFKEYLAPGDSSMLAKVLPWYKEDKHMENLYTWNDMNEPSVFNGPEVSMPRDVVHLQGTVEHRDVHNLYGMYVHRATYEGHLATNPNRRPFVLTRSFFIGTHKTSAVWTGDNFAQWDHLAVSIPMCVSMALGGISFIGADVGGFFKHPSEELIVRWHQFGALAYPFYRSHAHIETPRREPWMYSDTGRERMRQAAIRRYRLIPYYYTLFHEYKKSGTMIIRPIWYEFPLDANAHNNDVLDTQLLVGRDLLVRVVEKPFHEMPTASVYLPTTAWYDWYTHQRNEPGTKVVSLSEEHVPAYARSGSIIPMKLRLRRSASAMKRDPFTLQIFLDEKATAEGSLYVDDYTSFDYQKGDYVELNMTFKDNTLFGFPTVPRQAPSWGKGLEVERIIVTGISEAKVPSVVRNGNTELDFKVDSIGDSLSEIIIKLPNIMIHEPFRITFGTKSLEL